MNPVFTTSMSSPPRKPGSRATAAPLPRRDSRFRGNDEKKWQLIEIAQDNPE